MQRLAPALLACLLSACAAKSPLAQLPPGPPPGIDGVYRGTARLIRGDRLCPRSGPRPYKVEAGLVKLAYSAGGRRRVELTAAVDPDGTIRASDGVGTLDGKVHDGLLEVTVSSSQCEHRWTLHKVS